MPVDIVTETVISRPRAEVAAYAIDPQKVTSWYVNIKQVDMHTPPPLDVGSRLTFVAKFLCSRLHYTYEVREWVPDERFVMSTEDGPFPMETTYEWEDTPGGGTLMRLRNRGEPAGVSKLSGKLMGPAVRRANRKDLARLKARLEGSSP